MRDVIIEGSRSLHNEDLPNMCSFLNIATMTKPKKDVIESACSTYRMNENCIEDSGKKASWKETTGKSLA
jgi:hypothetical protein